MKYMYIHGGGGKHQVFKYKKLKVTVTNMPVISVNIKHHISKEKINT